jgi:integrase
MSLKLFKRKGSDKWYLRGSVRSRAVFESTGVTERCVAETIRILREKELLDESVFGRKATATFIEAAVSYLEHGGERRFVGPLIDYFRSMPLAAIDQNTIDQAAATIYPKVSNATRVRQFYVPLSAILRHAALRGLCEHRVIERPSLPKGRVRWITPEEADRLIAACADHLRPLVIFLLYTGARLSEALYLPWKQVDFIRREVQFLKTKSGDARGVPLHQRVIDALTTDHYGLLVATRSQIDFLNARRCSFRIVAEERTGHAQQSILHIELFGLLRFAYHICFLLFGLHIPLSEL